MDKSFSSQAEDCKFKPHLRHQFFFLFSVSLAIDINFKNHVVSFSYILVCAFSLEEKKKQVLMDHEYEFIMVYCALSLDRRNG